jgi:hypothetical protein
MAFAKLKALLRAKALRIEELCKALGLVGCFSATERSNYFRHADYLQSG